MRNYLLSLFATLLVVLMPAAAYADELTVNDGTTTNVYVPAYGSYFDTNGAHSQSFFPADLLTGLVGADITSMTFYSSTMSTPTGSSYSSWDGVALIAKIVETTNASLSSAFEDLSNATVVNASFAPTLVNGEFVIVFDDPYVYQGGNLVIDIATLTKGSYKSVSWYGVSSSACYGRYATGSTASGSTSFFAPKATFTYEPGGEITCEKVGKPVVSNIAPDSARISWPKGAEETEWLVKLGAGEYFSVEDTTYLFEGLNPNTKYTFEVRAFCGEGDTARAVGGNFKTACGVITSLPWAENFEGSNITDCWLLPASGVTVYSTSSYSHSPSHALQFATTSEVVVALSQFADLAGKEIKFWWRNEGTNTGSGRITIGYIVDDDESTFVAISEKLPQVFVMTEYLYLYPNNVPANARPAIKYTDATTSAWYGFVDDIIVREAPTCRPPRDLHFTEAVGSTATFAWTAANGESQWVLKHKLALDPAYTVDTISTTPEFVQEGLSPNTNYTLDYILYSLCDGVLSVDSVVATVDFTSECSPIEPANDSIVINFDNYATNSKMSAVPCWEVENSGASTNYWKVYNSYAHSAPNAAYVYIDKKGDRYDMTTPALNVPGGWQVSFYARNSSSSYTDSLQVYVIDLATGDTTLAFSTGKLPVAYQDKAYHFDLSNFDSQIKLLFRASGDASGYAIVDDIVLTAKPNCQPAGNFRLGAVGSHTAEFFWEAGEPDQTFSIIVESVKGYYGEAEVDSAAVVLGLTDGLDELPAQTKDTFTVTITALCGEDKVEAEPYIVENLIFTTDCAPISTEGFTAGDTIWSDGFEDYSIGSSSVKPVAGCWKFLGVNNGAAPYCYVSNKSDYTHTGSKNLYFEPSTSQKPAIAALPAFSDVSDAQLTVWYSYEGSSSGTLSVGYMTNMDDTASFVVLQNLTKSSPYKSSHYSDAIPLSNVPAGARVAVRYVGSGTNWFAGIDDVVVTMMENCRKITNVKIDDITTTAMTLEWDTAYQESDWELLIKQGRDTLVFDTVQVTSLTIDTLKPATKYTYSVRIKAVCDGVAATDYFEQSMNFTTECVPVAALPWKEDFETVDADALPICFGDELAYHGTYTYPHVTTGTAHSGTKSLYFYGNNTYQAPQIVMLPEFTADLSNARLTFWHKETSTTAQNAKLIVGYVTDETDADSFVALDTIAPSTTYAWAEVELGALPAEGFRLALKIGAGSTSNSIYVDDIKVDEIPACHHVESMTLVDSLLTGYTASFLVKGSAESYKVLFLGKDTIEKTISAPDSIVVLDNLNPGGTYNYVAKAVAICGSSVSPDTMEWSFAFSTLCMPLEMPYSEDFESAELGSYLNPGIPCWEFPGASHSSAYTYPIVKVYNENGYYRGTKSLFFQSSSSVSVFAVLPEIEGDLSQAEISFAYRMESATSSGKLFVGYLTDVADTTTFVSLYECRRITSFADSIFSLESVPAGARLAFKYAKATSSNYYMAIDDIKVRLRPTCFPATNLHVIDSMATLNSAAFGWNPYDAENLHAHVIVKSGNDTIYDTLVEDSVFVINNLESSRTYKYDITVYTMCGALESTDALVGSLRLNTVCETKTTLPIFYGFEESEGFDVVTSYVEENTLPACFLNDTLPFPGTSSTRARLWSAYASSATAMTGHNSHAALSLPDKGYSTVGVCETKLVFPQFEIPADENEYEVRFWINRSSSLSSGTNYEGARIYLSKTGDIDTTAIEMAFASRYYNVADTVGCVPAETTSGWYRYNFNVPAGTWYLIFKGESYYSSSTYFDDVEIRRKPTCFQPTNFSDSIGTDSIMFSWTGNSEKYAIKVWGDTTINDTVDVTSFVIRNLKPATIYKDTVSITGICGEEISEALVKNLAFTTECVALTMADIPFVDGFESYSAFPVCWGRTNTSYPSLGVSETNAHTGSKYLSYYSSTSATYYMTLPEFADDVDLNALRLKFWYKNNGTSYSYSQFEVGTMSDPADPSTFVLVTALDRKSVYTQADVLFNDVPENHHYLAIRLTIASSYSYTGYNYIDDVEVVLAPTCKDPKDAKMEQIEATSAVLKWTGYSADYKVSYKLSGVADTVLVENADSILLEGLTPATAYTISDLKIQGFCSATDSSEVVSFTTINFATECVAGNLPYSTSFEADDDSRKCWNIAGPCTYDNATSRVHSGSTSLRFSNAVTGNVTLLPEFVQDLNGKVVKFWYLNENTTNSGYITLGYVLNDEFTPIAQQNKATAYTEVEITLANIPAGARLAIHYGNGTSENYWAWIDDFEIFELATCFAPNAVEVAEVGMDSVVLVWNDKEALGYEVVIDEVVNTVLTDTVLVIKDLTADTQYNWTVALRSICEEGDSSSVATFNVSFTTLPAPIVCDTIQINPTTHWETGFELGDGFVEGALAPCFNNVADNWAATTDQAHNGAQSVGATYLAANDTLILPVFELANESKLAFWVYAPNAAGYLDTLRIYANGELKSEITTATTGQNDDQQIAAVTTDWIKVAVQLEAGLTDLMIAYINAENGFHFYIDDMLLTDNNDPTGIGTVDAKSKNAIEKLLINNRVYIRRADALYDVTGRLMK